MGENTCWSKFKAFNSRVGKRIFNFFGKIFWLLIFFLNLHHVDNKVYDPDERMDQLVVVSILENYLQLKVIVIVLWMGGSTIALPNAMSILSSIITVSRSIGQATSIFTKNILKYWGSKDKSNKRLLCRNIFDLILILFFYIQIVLLTMYSFLNGMLSNPATESKKFQKEFL